MANLEIVKKEIIFPDSSKKPTMVIGHFSPHELNDLDELQGGAKRNSAGVRTYNHLWHSLLKHKPIQESFLHTARQHHASGGAIHAQLARMRSHGRYGDSEVAYIPHGMADLLDKAIGGRVCNPHDGKPEYFLGAKLAPLMGMLRSGATKAGQFARTMGAGARKAGTAISGGLRRAGASVSRGLTQAANYVRNKPTQTVTPAEIAPAQTWADYGRENGGYYGGKIGGALAAPIGTVAGGVGGHTMGRALGGMSSVPFGGTLGGMAGGLGGSMIGGPLARKAGDWAGNKVGAGIGGALGHGVDVVANSPVTKGIAHVAQTLNPATYYAPLLANLPPPAASSTPEYYDYGDEAPRRGPITLEDPD